MKTWWLSRRHKAICTLSFQLLRYTVALCLLLLGVLIMAHYLMALRELLYVVVSPRILGLMIPHMSLFALPLAFACAVGIVSGKMWRSGIALLAGMLTGLRRAWYGLLIATCLFSGGISYYLLMYAGPQCYRAAKRELSESIARAVQELPPGVMHAISSRLSIGFAAHYQRSTAHVFSQMTLIVGQANDAPAKADVSPPSIMIVAKRGLFKNNELTLMHGSIQFCDAQEQTVYNHFEKMTLPYRFYCDPSGLQAELPSRYLSTPELVKRGHDDDLSEWWRRMIQLIWCLVLPLLMALCMPARPRRDRGAGIVRVLGVAGALFCVLYAAAHGGAGIAAP